MLKPKRKRIPDDKKRLWLMLRDLGGPSVEFGWDDMVNAWGTEFASRAIRMTCVERISGGGHFGIGGRAVYRLAEGDAARCIRFSHDKREVARFEWALQKAAIRELEDLAKRDDEELSRRLARARIPSVWEAIEGRRIREERFAKGVQGRCVSALRAAERPMTRAELEDALGQKINNRDIREALVGGRIVRIRTGLYGLPESTPLHVATTKPDALVLLLLSGGPMAAARIARKLDLPRRRCKEGPLKRARQHGYVEHVDTEKYALTEAGVERAMAILKNASEISRRLGKL